MLCGFKFTDLEDNVYIKQFPWVECFVVFFLEICALMLILACQLSHSDKQETSAPFISLVMITLYANQS